MYIPPLTDKVRHYGFPRLPSADINLSNLHCQVDGERPTLSLSSLFGRKFKKRRKKQHITVDDLEDPDSEDDDYKVSCTHVINNLCHGHLMNSIHHINLLLLGPRSKKEPQGVRGRSKKVEEAGE